MVPHSANANSRALRKRGALALAHPGSKIADFDGDFTGVGTPDSAHASPSVINATTPIAQYPITRAGKDRDLSSVQSQPTITSSITDTKSDK